jgi:hypothetical protein
MLILDTFGFLIFSHLLLKLRKNKFCFAINQMYKELTNSQKYLSASANECQSQQKIFIEWFSGAWDKT